MTKPVGSEIYVPIQREMEASLLSVIGNGEGWPKRALEMLKSGANATELDHLERNAIHNVVFYSGNLSFEEYADVVELIEALVLEGADINLKDSQEQSPLRLALLLECNQLVSWFAKNDAVLVEDADLQTLCDYHEVRKMPTFLENKETAIVKDCSVHCRLDKNLVAAFARRETVSSKIITEYFGEDSEYHFYRAAYLGQIDEVKRLALLHPDSIVKTTYEAILGRRLDVFTYLYGSLSEEKRAEIKYTLLFDAVMHGFTEALPFLTEQGCDPNHKPFGGSVSAYQWALGFGCQEILDELLRLGAHANEAVPGGLKV